MTKLLILWQRSFVKYKKQTATISLPEPLMIAIDVKAEKERISISHAFMRLICIGLGINAEEYEASMSKSNKNRILSSQVIYHIDPIYEEHPKTPLDFMMQPRRTTIVYAALLRDGAKWGDGTEITRNEKRAIETASQTCMIERIN